MATLVRTQGSHQGKWVYPVGCRCVLGRHTECDISDIFVDNSGVSRFHALLELVGGRYYVEDKGSRNGTFLNGRRLTGRVPLRNGDRLGIANVELTFHEDAANVAAPAGSSPTAVNCTVFAEPAGPAAPLSSLPVEEPSAGSILPGYSGDKLRALVQMLKQLGRSLDIDATLHELLAGLFAIFPQAQGGYVAFTAEGQDDVTPRATHFHPQEANPCVRISRTLVRHVLSNREAVLWQDQQRLVNSTTLAALQVCALMCAPLLDGAGNPFGVVQIDTDQPMSAFTSEDLEVMVGAVGQAAVAVRFARLHEEALRRQAVERDMELARRVQLSLLPEGYPDCEGFEFFAYYRAAYDVGGDYYDFIELPNDRLALVVADAAGKGVSAALMVAKLSGELKYHLSCQEPVAAFARMNESFCTGNTGRFVTLLAAILDRRSGTLTLLNAGHPAPLRRGTDGSVQAVGESVRGPALGLIPGCQYVETRSAIEPGEVWLAYTDGFTEATGAKGEMFGATQLRQRLTQAPAVVRKASDRIVREVLAFQGDQPQGDDMCLLGWGRLTERVERTGDSGAIGSLTTKRFHRNDIPLGPQGNP
jgi:serine phosphatase RsbU (regulator of sigma subunit)